MKKTLILLSLLLCVLIINAQIPAGYYNNAEGQTGAALKTALYNIIKGHKQYSYTEDTTDVWDILKHTDKDPNNSLNVIQIYTGWSVNAAQEYNGGNGWEREHIWAKSHGDFGTEPPAGTDVHHLRPINRSVNSARNNRWFANCTEPYLVNGSPCGSFTSTTQYVWMPRPQDKGDVARMIFYMATRYEGQNGEVNLEIVDYIPTDNNDPSPIMAKLSDLLQWHIDDPVDNWEINRNNIIYTFYQHNRNPFIDHPEYVKKIWGDPNSVNESVLPKFTVYPNPANDIIHIETSEPVDNVIIYNITGKQMIQTKEKTINTTELEPGLYIISIQSNKYNHNQKISIK